MPNTLWSYACGGTGTLHDRRRRKKRRKKRFLGETPTSRCHRCYSQTGPFSLEKRKKKNLTGVKITEANNTHIINPLAILITTAWWIIIALGNKEVTTIKTIRLKKRRREKEWITVTVAPFLALPFSSLVIIIILCRTVSKLIISYHSIGIAVRRTGISNRLPGKRTENETEEDAHRSRSVFLFFLVISSFLLTSFGSLLLSPVITFAVTAAIISPFRINSGCSRDNFLARRSLPPSSPPLVARNPRRSPQIIATNNSNIIYSSFSLVIKFKIRLLSPPLRDGLYYIFAVFYVLIAVPALKQKIKDRIHKRNQNLTVILYQNWVLLSGMPRPLDDEFSYEPPGKRNRSSDSTDNTGSSTTSNRKEVSVTKMSKSPRGNQKAASTDMPTVVPKSDIRRAQFKCSKSMPAVDASSPEPIFSSAKETEEMPVAIEMSPTGRPVETTNLHLKYLLQVTDSEFQNISREDPSSQAMSMGMPSTGKPVTNTQLILAPVTTNQPSENFIFQDSLEQQGLKLLYTKPSVDTEDTRPRSYVAYKPPPQHHSTEKSLQQQSTTGDTSVGRKRKHPQKQGRHICQYCGRGCAKPSVLEKHIRAHTNERPFPCANCGLSFKTKSNLSKHTKSRTHALKAGLSQSTSSTSLETAGTEGDVDAKDPNESEETQTETSDTDENEEDPQKLKKEMSAGSEFHARLMRGNSEPDTRLRLEVFKEKKCLSLKESLLFSDCSQSVTTSADTKGSGFGGANINPTEMSDNVRCHMFRETSKNQQTETGYLQHASTAYNPAYLPEKKCYVSKLSDSKSASFEGTWDEPSHSISETTSVKSSLVKENQKFTKLETIDMRLGTSWLNKDNAVSELSLSNKLPSCTLNAMQGQQSVKESEETKSVSSLIIPGGAPMPSTKEMVEKRISQLISENASIVNTPMKEPPRQKRISRQFSDPPMSHAPKLDDLPQSSSISKVSIPSISSIPLTPIPGDTDLRKDTSNSPKPFLVSDKYNSQNVVSLTGKSQILNLAATSSKPSEHLVEKINSGGTGGHSNSHEIKIEIKLSKVATMSSLVATTATVAQTVLGQQSSIQYIPAASAMTPVNKNPENSVIKDLLMKGKTLPASFNSQPSVKSIKEKSSSVDDISKFKRETSAVSPLLHGEMGTSSNVEFSVGSRSSQLYKMHLCHSGPATTNVEPQMFESGIQYEHTDKPKLDKCGSTEKDSFSGSLSHSLSTDRESSNDFDTEKGSKDDKMDSAGLIFENYDQTLPKKKGRPKGSKNKPKNPPSNPVTLQLQYQPSTSTPSSTQQTSSLLLATLKKKSTVVSQSPLVSPITTVSTSMIRQPVVSIQNSWPQPNPMAANPVSTPSTPTKLKLKGKILMKRSMSTDRIQSQEQESEIVSTCSSTGSTSSVKENSANVPLIWTASLDAVKQTIESERNERDSPLKKRKVRTSELSDTVIRPGVTRAGSEPLMSRMGLSWSGSTSMKMFAEKRLSSLPETLEYKLVKTLPPVTLPSLTSASITVPVVIAEPIGVPMKFFDSFQSSSMARSLFPIPAHHSTLPTISASSKQSKDTIQQSGISGLVSFLLHKKGSSQELEEEVESTSKVEESTNNEHLISTKTFQTQDDVDISSQLSSVIQGSHSSSQSLNSGHLTNTTTEVDLIQQHLYGHSVNSLRGLTHTTLCCVQQVQPMYVAQGDNRSISMYSNWKISEPTQDSGSFTARMLISLYNSKQVNDPIFVISSAKSCELNAVDSCKWSLYNKPKTWNSSSYAIEKLTNGIFNIFTTKPDSSKLTSEMKLLSEDKDLLNMSGGSMESTPSSLGVKDGQSTKQPKRVRIFQGGFRSNEDYIYIRGRGRGKYVCEECGIRCKKPSMLKKHIRTHTDLRPYHCRHCRLSFKTKGNLTKHMKSKAHQKKCLELGIVPVPVTVDESQIDSVALAAQSAIAKETKSLDDDNDEDEEDDKDVDDEEETDDADGQFSDSEESARTSFERMDTSETIDTSVDKESEWGTSAKTSSIDVAEPYRIPEVHSCDFPEVSTSEFSKSTSNPLIISSPMSGSLQTLTTLNTTHRQGATSQLQFVNEIAHSLLDLAQRQIPLADELSHPHPLDATDSVILITTSTTATNTTTTTISTTRAIAVSIQSKAEVTEKTLKRQYSFDMDDSPDRGFNKSPISQVEMPNLQVPLISENFQKSQYPVLKQTSSEEIAMINQQVAIAEIPPPKEIREEERERMHSQQLTHPSMLSFKTDSQESYLRSASVTTTPVPSDQPLTPKVYLIPDILGNFQGCHGAMSTSTLSFALTSRLPNISQLMKPEAISGGVIGSVSSDVIVSHPQSITPFQFEHPFQAFQRPSNNKNKDESRDESQTVIIPLNTSGTEVSSFVSDPQTVTVAQTISRESSIEMMGPSSEATTNCQQNQILLPTSQQGTNNTSVVSIILSNQTLKNAENTAQQQQNERDHQSQVIANSLCTVSTNTPQVISPIEHFNTNIVVEPQLVENFMREQSQQRAAELQPLSLIMEKDIKEHKVLITRQSPPANVEKDIHSEERYATFGRQSSMENSPRPLYGNVQTRVHVERRIPMLEVQPMIPNVQLPSQEVGKLSPTQQLRSLSPMRQYVGQLSAKEQHVERLSPTCPLVERLSPTHPIVDRLSPTRQHVERPSPTRQRLESLSPTRQRLESLSPTRQHVERLSPTRQHVERLSPTRQHVERLSPTRQHVESLSPARPLMERLSPTQQHVERLSHLRQHVERQLSIQQHVERQGSTKQYLERQGSTQKHLERQASTQQHLERQTSTEQHLERQASAHQHLERLSPMHQHLERLSPTRQQIERLSPMLSHAERFSPTWRHVERLSLTQPHVDRLSPTTPHRDILSSTQHHLGTSVRQHMRTLSPSRHVDALLPSRSHVDTLSSNQPMDMVSSLRQPNIDKQIDRLSPSKKLICDRLSPIRQHADNVSLTRQLSPTNQHMDRLTTFRANTEKLSPTPPFSNKSSNPAIDKLSPTRLTDKPPFKKQTNRLSPTRHVEVVSPSKHVEGVFQSDRQSPSRRTERMSPARYENVSPTRIQARPSHPCRPEQKWASDPQLPLQLVETQSPILDGQLCTTTETQANSHQITEKQLMAESHISSHVSPSQIKALTTQPNVERMSPFKDSSCVKPLTLQKSFKDDLNKCHTCNKCFSNVQEYTEHRRQHMKTQTHHSQDSSCGHSRPHLHKCFHSEGHADSRSMSTEEIPRPPNCENCKMDFWKQNHLPKHLWVKKHRLTLMQNKNSSSTESESAAPSDIIPDSVVTSLSASSPSRGKTIQGTEKALDLSLDESASITSLSSSSSTCMSTTCTTVTTTVTTTAAVTVATAAVIPDNIGSHESALIIAEKKCISREQQQESTIMSADNTDHSSFFIHQRQLCKDYMGSSREDVKGDETEILRSDNRNPTYYVLTGDESEIPGTNVVPVAAAAAHACHLCSSTFASAGQLKTHLFHADPRPFVCEFCDAGFSKKQTLRIHLQTHSQQEKPYICGTCGDTFVTSESLKQHHSLTHVLMVETHRSFDESALHSYQQGTRIDSSPLPKSYNRVHLATQRLCSQGPFSTSFPPMMSNPVQVSALSIHQKQVQYELPSSQAQQYLEMSPYSTGNTGPGLMVPSTLTVLELDSVVSKP